MWYWRPAPTAERGRKAACRREVVPVDQILAASPLERVRRNIDVRSMCTSRRFATARTVTVHKFRYRQARLVRYRTTKATTSDNHMTFSRRIPTAARHLKK